MRDLSIGPPFPALFFFGSPDSVLALAGSQTLSIGLRYGRTFDLFTIGYMLIEIPRIGLSGKGYTDHAFLAQGC